MIWEINTLAAEQRRVFSRILQILESQMVRVHSFHGNAHDGSIRVTVTFSCEEDKGSRIEALIYRLEGVSAVSVRSVQS
jgi:hypothetical protein